MKVRLWGVFQLLQQARTRHQPMSNTWSLEFG